jgi:hypothetical protein
MASLAIYISQACPGCARARDLAALARDEHPELDVRVIDVDRAGRPLPDAVVAVPAYVLDDAVIALGNPDADLLRRKLIASSERRRG